jgi:hypothetical protein
MNRSLFAIAGFMMALAVVAAAPGTAGATPIAATSLDLVGASLTTGTYAWGDNWTVLEGPDTTIRIPGLGQTSIPAWTITGSDTSGLLVTDPVSGGTLVITGTTIKITGTIVDASPSGVSFTMNGTLSNFKNSSYDSWDVTFKNLTGLSNTDFSVVDTGGIYAGSISVTTSGEIHSISALSSTITSVPISSALLLLAPGLLGLIGMRKRLKG